MLNRRCNIPHEKIIKRKAKGLNIDMNKKTKDTIDAIKEIVKETEENKEQLNKDRELLFEEQRAERGFDDSETWNLDHTIAVFVLPRLKAFKEVHCGSPCQPNKDCQLKSIGEKEWNQILDKMIYAFEIHASEDMSFGYDLDHTDQEKFSREYKERMDKVSEGLKLFAKWYGNLWD